ncbi:MAG: AMP-binding protein [Desulfobacterota bacterium]|nr:AMP-binding protein [Thermodesulfobacteriota bacterium]
MDFEKGDTWPQILKYNFEKYGDTRRALRHKHHGIWQPYTWKDYYARVKALALGLFSLGLKAGDRVLIVGDNAPQWYYADLAIQAGHGVAVGAYSDLTPNEIHYLAENSEAAFAIVQDQEQVDKLLQIRDTLPLLKRILFWSYKGLAHYKDSSLLGFREVMEEGERHGKENPGLFERQVESGKADDVCAIVYTSGTTGDHPKGALHTFRTLRAGSDVHLRLDPWRPDDTIVPYLPPVWIMEQWLALGCHLLSGCTLHFAEGPETQERDAREVGPSIVFRGARLWESQAAAVQARISRADAFKKMAFRWLMPVGRRMAEAEYRKENPGLLTRLSYALAGPLLFNPIRESLGLRRARICYTSGTMLSEEAFKFYHALNLPLKNLYGTTEGGALSGAKDENLRVDTVGRPHEGAEVRVSDEGEILYRQPGGFPGYHKDPDQTAEVLKDGWFHTGDCGFIDDQGHLVLLGRKRSLVRLANGDSLSPQSVESRLRYSPYIKDAWVLAGPEALYASAVIVINYNTVGPWAGEQKVHFSNFAELAQRPEVYELVKQDILRVNATLSPGSRVRKYVVFHREFDPDEGELTRNRRLRRSLLEKRHKDLIEAVYRDRTEVTLSDGGAGRTALRIESVEGVGT